jgi:predicted enzyme related to lactoylglutathione lyase
MEWLMRIEFTLDCNDLDRMAAFWTQVLGYRSNAVVSGRYTALSPRSGECVTLTLQRVTEGKTTKNRLHLDLLVEHLEEEVARIESLGATRLTPSALTEFGQRWYVMADLEGNEFCLAQESEGGIVRT